MDLNDAPSQDPPKMLSSSERTSTHEARTFRSLQENKSRYLGYVRDPAYRCLIACLPSRWTNDRMFPSPSRYYTSEQTPRHITSFIEYIVSKRHRLDKSILFYYPFNRIQKCLQQHPNKHPSPPSPPSSSSKSYPTSLTTPEQSRH